MAAAKALGRTGNGKVCQDICERVPVYKSRIEFVWEFIL